MGSHQVELETALGHVCRYEFIYDGRNPVKLGLAGVGHRAFDVSRAAMVARNNLHIREVKTSRQ